MCIRIVEKLPVLFFAVIVIAGCRAPSSDDDTESEEDTETDTYTDTDEIPDAGPNGTCPANSWDEFDNTDAPFAGGEKEVRVEVSISTDFHCPHCLQFAMGFMETLDKQDYIDFVRIYFHHYPLYTHPESWDVHFASIAVSNQSLEKFWMLHDEVFNREFAKDRMTIEEVVQYADNVLELDMDQFNEDRVPKIAGEYVMFDREQADDLGFSGTPSVWVCGTKVSWGDLEETVESHLYGN